MVQRVSRKIVVKSSSSYSNLENSYNYFKGGEVLKSKVFMMCGPAGAGKSTLAKKFERQGMVSLSYDAESFKRGLTVHPLPKEIEQEIKVILDGQLITLIKQNKDVVLDYSFWSLENRREYISLLKTFGIKPLIFYIETPKEIVMERLSQRAGKHPNDIVLSIETASQYYEQFQKPSREEAEIIVVKGY